MKYTVNPAVWSRVFPIPCDITDKHIKLCSGLALKCLLLILRSPDEFSDPSVLAKKLGQPQSEITDALNFWEEQGLLAASESEVVPTFKAISENDLPLEQSSAVKAEPAKIETKAAPPPSRPRFPRDEALCIIDGDDILHSLMQELQEVLGKPLTSADTDVLVALYSFYGLSAHFILSLVHYCASIGKRGMAYAEKVAVSWINDGVDDSNIDSHIDKLYNRRSNEGLVRRTFGISDRNLTTKEKEYITAWFDAMGFDINVIQHAYEVTVDRTGKTVFGYINKILADWHRKGIKTLSDAKAESSAVKKPTDNKEQLLDETDLKIIEQFMKS